MSSCATSKTLTCTGKIISSVTVDWSKSDEGDIDATATVVSGNWDEDTEIEVEVKCGYIDKKFKFNACSSIETGSGYCGGTGDITFDLSSVLDGNKVDSCSIAAAANACDVKISTKGKGYEDTCDAQGSLSSAYQAVASSYQAVADSPGKSVGVAVGAIALIGLAAYAVKRRFRATSKTVADERLYRGGQMA